MTAVPHFVVVRPGCPDCRPFRVQTFDIAKRARLLREGASADEALAASTLPIEAGKVTIRVSALNAIIATSRLTPAELVQILTA